MSSPEARLPPQNHRAVELDCLSQRSPAFGGSDLGWSERSRGVGTLSAVPLPTPASPQAVGRAGSPPWICQTADTACWFGVSQRGIFDVELELVQDILQLCLLDFNLRIEYCPECTEAGESWKEDVMSAARTQTGQTSTPLLALMPSLLDTRCGCLGVCSPSSALHPTHCVPLMSTTA